MISNKSVKTVWIQHKVFASMKVWCYGKEGLNSSSIFRPSDTDLERNYLNLLIVK